MRFDNSQLSSNRSIAPFFSPHIMSILYISVWLAALVTIALWPNRNGYHLMLGSNIPIVFMAVFVFVLIMTSYTQMRCGRGELVRYATEDQGNVDGIGIRFLDFSENGAARLHHHLVQNGSPVPGDTNFTM